MKSWKSWKKVIWRFPDDLNKMPQVYKQFLIDQSKSIVYGDIVGYIGDVLYTTMIDGTIDQVHSINRWSEKAQIWGRMRHADEGK